MGATIIDIEGRVLRYDVEALVIMEVSVIIRRLVNQSVNHSLRP